VDIPPAILPLCYGVSLTHRYTTQCVSALAPQVGKPADATGSQRNRDMQVAMEYKN